MSKPKSAAPCPQRVRRNDQPPRARFDPFTGTRPFACTNNTHGPLRRGRSAAIVAGRHTVANRPAAAIFTSFMLDPSKNTFGKQTREAQLSASHPNAGPTNRLCRSINRSPLAHADEWSRPPELGPTPSVPRTDTKLVRPVCEPSASKFAQQKLG